MNCVRLVLLALSVVGLVACNEEPPKPKTPAPQTVKATGSAPKITDSSATSADQGVGGVTLRILPEKPTIKGCLKASIQGLPGLNTITWKVNGSVIPTETGSQLCNEYYKRDDTVTAEVGTSDKGALASVTIGNSPPQIVDISSTPAKPSAGKDISITPVAEDADGDSVDFSYQWLINGEEDPVLVEATLPGSRFTKGDTVQVLIVPNDFYDDGPAYKSTAQLIPNTPPKVVSQPPQGVSSLEYRYQVEVSDPDDSTFSFHLEDAPQGMSIVQAGGLIQWSLVGVEPGEYTVAIVVADPDGAEATQRYILTLGVTQ